MFSDHYPEVAAILALEPEELGGIVLAYLVTAPHSEMHPKTSPRPMG